MNWSTVSRHKRGYGSEWEKKRELVMRRDYGMCQCSDCCGKVRLAQSVHHIVSRADARRRSWPAKKTESMSNLTSMNIECHEKLHGNEKRQETGADGWPIEKSASLKKVRV